jgi:hypothetical protein
VTSDHTVAGADDRDRPSPRAAGTDSPEVPEQRRWRFVSAVHAAKALNGQQA